MELFKRKYRTLQQFYRTGDVRYLPQYKKWYQLKWSFFKTDKKEINVMFPEFFQSEDFIKTIISNEVIREIAYKHGEVSEPRGMDIYI